MLVLAHWQPRDCRIGTPIDADAAEFLVSCLAAERISRKVIQLFSPESIFALTKRCPEVKKYIPDEMPGGEIPGVYFQEPSAPPSNIPRMQHLPRFREVWGDAQLAASL